MSGELGNFEDKIKELDLQKNKWVVARKHITESYAKTCSLNVYSDCCVYIDNKIVLIEIDKRINAYTEQLLPLYEKQREMLRILK